MKIVYLVTLDIDISYLTFCSYFNYKLLTQNPDTWYNGRQVKEYTGTNPERIKINSGIRQIVTESLVSKIANPGDLRKNNIYRCDERFVLSLIRIKSIMWLQNP